MNISKYMALAAAAEYGSFTKLAEILNYSQSAVSCMISDIEDEWGISVLERSKKPYFRRTEDNALREKAVR